MNLNANSRIVVTVPADTKIYIVFTKHQEKDPVDMRQTSRDKTDRLQRATAEFTTSAFDGCGLRCQWPARPAPFALSPGGLEVVDAQAADNGNEERTRRANLVVLTLLPADEGLLQHIFRIRDTSQHSICNGEEKAAILVKRGEPYLNFRAGMLFFNFPGVLISVRQSRLLHTGQTQLRLCHYQA